MIWLPGEVRLKPESEQRLAALRRAMARAGGFALFVVVCDGPARAEVRRRLGAWSGENGIPELRSLPSGKEGCAALERLLSELRPEAALPGLVIVDGDTLVAEQTPVHALNAARDRLAEFVEGPLVLLLSPLREAELARMAPDLFDVRSATYEVEAEPGERVELAALADAIHRAQQRAGEGRLPDPADLRELEAQGAAPANTLAEGWLLLAMAEHDRPESALDPAEEALRLALVAGYQRGALRALQCIARACIVSGRLDEAEQAVLRMLALNNEIPEAIGEALSSMAEILVERGQPDEALRLLRDEVSPVFEQMGDLFSLAIAKKAMADILRDQGQIEESLQILKADVLPLVEKLGALDLRLLVLVQIAGTLGVRGESEEALRILKEEALPICEGLDGDWARTAVMEQMAGVLLLKGQIGEALRIQREEVVPALERAGELHSLVWAEAHVALMLRKRDQPGDREAARELLEHARQRAEALGLAKAQEIRRLQEEQGLLPDLPA